MPGKTALGFAVQRRKPRFDSSKLKSLLKQLLGGKSPNEPWNSVDLGAGRFQRAISSSDLRS